MRDVEVYRVKSRMKDQVSLEKIEDLESLIELSPGDYVIKPVQGEGCWMDAISIRVVGYRLWEPAEEYDPVTQRLMPTSAVPRECRAHTVQETCTICGHPEFCPYFGGPRATANSKE